MIGVVVGEEPVEAARSCGTCLVACLLQLGEEAQVDVQHIGLRPYGTTVVQIVFIVVATIRCQLQGYHVFVVVAGVVATHTDEDCQLVVAQVIVVDEMVGVHEHLHVLILAQVECGITIDGLRLTRR